jgi:hypothetical protein
MALDVIPNQIFRSCKYLIEFVPLFFNILFSNLYISSVIYEFPWQTGFASFACYMYGIAYTISNVIQIYENIGIKVVFN